MKHLFATLTFVFLLVSCVGVPPTLEVQQVNLANDLAYIDRYRSLEELYRNSIEAHNLAVNYKDGKAEACNNLAFYYFLKMDFDKSKTYCLEVADLTINQLELLVADIGMMKIAQRTAQNKLFYDYRNSAMKRMKRIKEDQSLFDSTRDKIRLNYAFSEFYIVSVIYFYYLQQLDAAYEVMDMLDNYDKDAYMYEANRTDVTQLLFYKYIKASTGLVGAKSQKIKLLKAYDLLAQVYVTASEYGLIYFQGNALQGVADLMAKPDDYLFLKEERGHTFSIFKLPVNDELPHKIAMHSLAFFKEYNDLYQMAGVHLTLAKIDNYRANFSGALIQLKEAIACVNMQHELYFSSHHDVKHVDTLQLVDLSNEDPLELRWISEGVLTVPDWIGRIREQLSVTYAGLNDKFASDYNRNVYLDILDLVRQDKELESRFAKLQEEESLVNNLLTFLLVFILLISALFYILNKRARRKTASYIQRLQKCLHIGQELTASLPSEAIELSDIVLPIASILRPFLFEEFGVIRFRLDINVLADESETYVFDTDDSLESSGDGFKYALSTNDGQLDMGHMSIYLPNKITKEQHSFFNLLIPSITWAIENGIHFIDLGVEKDMLDKKLYITNQHNIEHRRENIHKRASMRIVYGIQPYIDRIRNEVDKLLLTSYAKDKEVVNYKLQYIQELITTIDVYNEVLAMWIKIKQGYLSLKITNFDLDELFNLVAKGKRPFELKQIEFVVHPTNLNVKADRALTLFMINTLLENARKYTHEGGRVELVAVPFNGGVEIAIQDTGVGLSEEEISLILREKIYDSKQIGKENDYIAAAKGGGFGLMNCKAIIDKYKKTNTVFEVCKFDIKSDKNKGSRFSFRLPFGIKKVLSIFLLISFFTSLMSCVKNPIDSFKEEEVDFKTTTKVDTLLDRASKLANEVYYANTRNDYAVALSKVDSAFVYLNQYYFQQTHQAHPFLQLVGDGVPAEILWFKSNVNIVYDDILYLRNEAAVASLALHRLEEYTYNNQAYTSLYKLYTKDESLDYYCEILQDSTSNKRVVITLLTVLFFASLFVYYFVYLNRRYMRRWSLEQVLDVYERIFSSSLEYTQHRDSEYSEQFLKGVPHTILKNSFFQLNNLVAIDWLNISLYDPEKDVFTFDAYPSTQEVIDADVIKSCFFSMEMKEVGQLTYMPLTVSLKQKTSCIGVLAFARRFKQLGAEDELYVQLIVKYLSTVLYNTMIRTAGRFRDIELVQNEVARLSWENNQIHIQNKILDNCLSAIKHETIYYPSRLKQIVGEVKGGESGVDILGAKDLVEYYYGIFTTLSLWAKQELEQVTFRRSTIQVATLVDYARNYYQKKAKKNKTTDITLKIDNPTPTLYLLGDEKLLQYLFELLIDDALLLKLAGSLDISVTTDVDFVHFSFSDNRMEFSKQELDNLFYPNLKWIDAGETKGISGQTFLLAKEIIREHDEYIGRRGCKIRAEVLDKGYRIIFSIVKNKNK